MARGLAHSANELVERYRSDPDQGFDTVPLGCLSGRDPCNSHRDLTDIFLLQYVQLSVAADAGAGCGGDARIVVDLDPGTRVIPMLDIEVSEGNNDTTTVVLPSPVRLRGASGSR